MITAYTHGRLPHHWIIQHGQVLWRVPRWRGGWAYREVFRGLAVNLSPLDEAAAQAACTLTHVPADDGTPAIVNLLGGN
jgi:hypothetical protein